MTHEQLEADGDLRGYIVLSDDTKTTAAFRRDGKTYALSFEHEDGKNERRRDHLAWSMGMSLSQLGDAA